MNKANIWIEAGYKAFAYEGPQSLRVEKLAKAVQKNKSSFYHFFADMEVFTLQLLDFHLAQSKIMSRKEAQAPNEAALIEVILDHKTDLLFNRQLRVHRENPDFLACFNKTNEIALPGFLSIWKKIIDLQENTYLAEMVLMLSIENFFLQITESTLNREWMEAYFRKIREMVRQFKIVHEMALLNGSV